MIGLAFTATAAQAVDITGAGSTFAAPIYGAWGAVAKSSIGVALNYQALGSGAGQNQVIARTVDFGASDAPLTAAKLQTNLLIQFPTVMGGVVPIVNLPGIAPNQLHLTGEVVAELFSGAISTWNDPKIAALNPGVKLPDTAVAPVHRADGSGTTFVFTSYLAKVSPDWKSKIGAASSIAWPSGAGAKGNDGVAATVRNTEGGLGYVEYAYADKNHLTTVELKDKAGAFVAPNLDSFTKAAAAADWASAQNFAVDLLDTPGEGAWPIVSATFVLLPTNPKDPARSAEVIKFFDWAFTNGAATARKLQYVPLPAEVQTNVRHAWTNVAGAPDMSR
ncbi:phosphate ABC transporter substrate-binding protein PstS [Lichenicola cladoniae]|uniref:Phosphate-binding protein PstS n=1 Tax=Lichenicola cladoniae TaxID=1484109 RepID=A0A6M8HWW0_9PROT|nr:phosphate ABC transporter substrate-binding protein PstS [Lichenicola cladoniae]NPD66134.1 phosphate ABC transporter substrate-binding protein PstS [Acetobacteraceae bacterium]QKE92820.1 phosphate ABC transporter substrate-binding protein PstS [Lichenicola cladoniae]